MSEHESDRIRKLQWGATQTRDAAAAEEAAGDPDITVGTRENPVDSLRIYLLRDALAAIAAPSQTTDYGWWTEMARKALKNDDLNGPVGGARTAAETNAPELDAGTVQSTDTVYGVDKADGDVSSGKSKDGNAVPGSPSAPSEKPLHTSDDIGLSIDMLDVDRLRQWAQNLLVYGPDITHWASVPHVVSQLQTLATGIEHAVRDIGQLRQSTPPASPAATSMSEDIQRVVREAPLTREQIDEHLRSEAAFPAGRGDEREPI